MAGDSFRNKVVIITGASAGIGREIALRLAREGSLLVLAARDPSLLDDATEACRGVGARAVAVPTDVGDIDQCRLLIERAVEAYGRIDALVNNAGLSMHARFEEIQDISIAEKITRINYLGSVWCTFFALPHLKKTGGRIVAVASLTGKSGVPMRTLYAGTKHAMAGFFDSLRIELRQTGVSVTVVYPGFVATDIAERAFGPDGRPLGTRPVRKEHVMTVEECARQTVEAAASRRRELVMTRLARFGLLVKPLFPGLVDSFAERGVRRGR